MNWEMSLSVIKILVWSEQCFIKTRISQDVIFKYYYFGSPEDLPEILLFSPVHRKQTP